MSNYKKTLANVKPGGMVRLGDALPPLPCTGYSAYSDGTEPLYTAEQMRDYARAALSAQPSPAGQGGLNYERMFVDACAALAEVSRELGCDPEQGGTEPILAAIAELREALAARQPVGEPVGTVHSGKYASGMPWCDVEWHIPQSAGTKLYAAPPAQAVDYQAALLAEERSHSKTIDQRDACEEVADELADHIARITGVDIGEHSSANCPWQNAIDAAEEYKPAHAVDLDELRRAVCLVNVVGQIDGHDVVRRNSVLDVIANRRQRLIDSRAVGNG